MRTRKNETKSHCDGIGQHDSNEMKCSMLCLYHTFSHREVEVHVEVAGHYGSMGEPTKAAIRSQRLQLTVID